MKNPNCSETSATIRIVGESVHPEELTVLIGISPTLRVSIGETAPAGTHPRREGIWAWSTKDLIDSTDLEDHVSRVLEQLPPNFRSLVPSGARCEILCVWRSATGHGGPSLSSELLARLAHAGVDLDFDFYSDVDN